MVDEERFSNVIDFDGSRWSGNPDQGYLFDDFNLAYQGGFRTGNLDHERRYRDSIW